MLRVGLTGGIACGKTQVLARFAAAGFHTLDLDRVAHEVMAPGGPAYHAVLAEFGSGILGADGGVDRKRLGALVFAEPAARERLNTIVHPHVRAEEARIVSRWTQEERAVVVSDAALLVEAGVHLRFDRLVVVHCSPEDQLRRLMARDGIDAPAARVRIDSQMPIGEKRRFAHLEVDTSGVLEDTVRRADQAAVDLALVSATRRPAQPVPIARALGCLLHGPQAGPRGLSPRRLVRELADAGEVRLARLSHLLDPPGVGPWYRAAVGGAPDGSPASLAGPVVLWSLARSCPDPPHVFAAMASLARLTHLDAVSIAGACLQARALLEVAVEGRVPEDFPARARRWRDDAARWGGAEPHFPDVFEAAVQHARDPAAARRAAAGGDLAGAIVGLAVGVSVDAAPPDLVQDLRGLETDLPGRSPLP
jgi:dephospho-CoA kinase